jgi:hypothetical protein
MEFQGAVSLPYCGDLQTHQSSKPEAVYEGHIAEIEDDMAAFVDQGFTTSFNSPAVWLTNEPWHRTLYILPVDGSPDLSTSQRKVCTPAGILSPFLAVTVGPDYSPPRRVKVNIR